MLYLEHFGLDEPPFRITPHTDFFFDGADRGATLDALLYAILQDEGIVKVSGEVGSGKTMLCRVLMERLPEHVEIVYLANPSLARDEILRAIADDLKVEFSEGRITVALRELEECLIALYERTHARLSGIYAFEAPRTLNLKGKGYTTVYQVVPAADPAVAPAGHSGAPHI